VTPPDHDRPSAQHEHRGRRAVQRMVEHAPHGGGLALWVRHQDLADDSLVDEAADGANAAPVLTDGGRLFYRPAFAALPLPEQTGWVAHAVLHIGLRHAQRYLELVQRRGDVDLRLFNLCADAIVNSALAHLRWLRLPEHALRLEQVLAQVLDRPADDARALLEWDVERLYLAVDDRCPPPPRAGRDGAGDGGAAGRADGLRAARLRALGAGSPADLQPRPDADADEAPETEAERSREWSERLQRAHAGDGEYSLLRALLADLPRVHTPWEQVLRVQCARALSHRPGLSWSRPARSYIANQGRAGPGRRLPWEPGTTAALAVPRLALVVDASGSIDEALLARFAREVQALVRRLDAALVLVVGDDAVRRVERHEPGRGRPPVLDGLVFRAGGGTDFTPLLEEAERHRPDLIVVLTDLDGPARHQPACPVLWAVPESEAHRAAPFGRRLVLR
jgi:hypothetical protein